jgi:hypothetical protein
MEGKRGSLVISYFGQGQRSLQTIEQLVADDRERSLLLSSELWLKKRTRQCSGVSFLKRPGIATPEVIQPVGGEARELLAIFSAARKTAKARKI